MREPDKDEIKKILMLDVDLKYENRKDNRSPNAADRA